MSAHTPGPWGYTYDGSSDWSIGPADDPQDRAVAHVWDRDDERARANVRLIAAAPDFLEAARLVLEGFDVGVFVRDTSRDHESSWGVRCLPYLAALGRLAKACGT